MVQTDRAGSADNGPVDNGSGQSTLDSRAALSPAARACISVALVLSVVAVPTWMMLKNRKRRRGRRQVSSEEDPQEEYPLIAQGIEYGHELRVVVRDLVKPKAPLVKDPASWRSFNPRKKKDRDRVLPKALTEYFSDHTYRQHRADYRPVDGDKNDLKLFKAVASAWFGVEVDAAALYNTDHHITIVNAIERLKKRSGQKKNSSKGKGGGKGEANGKGYHHTKVRVAAEEKRSHAINNPIDRAKRKAADRAMYLEKMLQNPTIAVTHFNTATVFLIVSGILAKQWPKLGGRTISKYVEDGGFIYIGITKLSKLKGEALRWLTTRGKRKTIGDQVLYAGRNKPVLVWKNRNTITMGDAESELGFDYFDLVTDKFAGSPSRFNSRLIEGELQRRLHKHEMGYERGWRHPDMGAYKDKAGEWVRVFLTFSGKVQGELDDGNIIIQNKDGDQVERGTEEIYWDEAEDGPWDADRRDADDITSASDSDADSG